MAPFTQGENQTPTFSELITFARSLLVDGLGGQYVQVKGTCEICGDLVEVTVWADGLLGVAQHSCYEDVKA